MNEDIKNKIQTDLNFRFGHNTKCRIYHALNGELKSSSSIDIIGRGIEIYRKWIEFQMTPNMNRKIIEIDHVKPISSFDVSKGEELTTAFN